MDEKALQRLIAEAADITQDDVGVLRGENLTLVITRTAFAPVEEAHLRKRLRDEAEYTRTDLGIIAFGYDGDGR